MWGADRPPAVEHEDLDWVLEARLIAEAEASADADLLIPIKGVRAWMESLATDNPLPMPKARKLDR